MRRLPAAVLLACLALAGCSLGPEPSSAPPSVEPSEGPSPTLSAAPTPEPFPLMTIEIIGGECPSGLCDRLINVDADGRLHEVIPKDRSVGQVPDELFEALRVEMNKADFQLIASKPFTGQCPTAVDGQELIYTFHLLSGDEEVRSCKVAIPPSHPLFRAVAAVMARVSR